LGNWLKLGSPVIVFVFFLILLFITVSEQFSVFAQSEIQSEQVPTLVGEVNVVDLPDLQETSQSFEIPFLTKDPESYEEMKTQQEYVQSPKVFARKLTKSSCPFKQIS